MVEVFQIITALSHYFGIIILFPLSWQMHNLQKRLEEKTRLSPILFQMGIMLWMFSSGSVIGEHSQKYWENIHGKAISLIWIPSLQAGYYLFCLSLRAKDPIVRCWAFLEDIFFVLSFILDFILICFFGILGINIAQALFIVALFFFCVDFYRIFPIKAIFVSIPVSFFIPISSGFTYLFPINTHPIQHYFFHNLEGFLIIATIAPSLFCLWYYRKKSGI